MELNSPGARGQRSQGSNANRGPHAGKHEASEKKVPACHSMFKSRHIIKAFYFIVTNYFSSTFFPSPHLSDFHTLKLVSARKAPCLSLHQVKFSLLLHHSSHGYLLLKSPSPYSGAPIVHCTHRPIWKTESFLRTGPLLWSLNSQDLE